VQQLKKTTGLNIIEDTPPTQDKVSRASAVTPTIEAGRVKLLDGRYIDTFLNECSAFPNGNHDDMVDTLVMCVNKYTISSKNVRAFSM
jgi:predicted phage terminase large subunit-like protein